MGCLHHPIAAWNQVTVILTKRGLCACSAESQTLTADVCSKVKVYFKMPSKGVGDKPWWLIRIFFLKKRKNKEGGLNQHLVTFLNHNFKSMNVSGLWFSGQVAQGSEVYLPWKNNLSLYINDDLYNGSSSTLMMLETIPILVIWLWLINVQLAQNWGQKAQERE